VKHEGNGHRDHRTHWCSGRIATFDDSMARRGKINMLCAYAWSYVFHEYDLLLELCLGEDADGVGRQVRKFTSYVRACTLHTRSTTSYWGIADSISDEECCSCRKATSLTEYEYVWRMKGQMERINARLHLHGRRVAKGLAVPMTLLVHNFCCHVAESTMAVEYVIKANSRTAL